MGGREKDSLGERMGVVMGGTLFFDCLSLSHLGPLHYDRTCEGHEFSYAGYTKTQNDASLYVLVMCWSCAGHVMMHYMHLTEIKTIYLHPVHFLVLKNHLLHCVLLR